ncbi:uncharacterized protein LOC129602230 [Paramacrobiotus metropolitanus]|uniref:uncharacterized protein LOC129602230 n=1 Tax=Paramacrobiotus metropolitanus TaxID=2943436 RepID=UPI0024457FB0|nr:uncharacterized protein LOC129602230 [Paramacrobiotus metropolitanus]
MGPKTRSSVKSPKKRMGVTKKKSTEEQTVRKSPDSAHLAALELTITQLQNQMAALTASPYSFTATNSSDIPKRSPQPPFIDLSQQSSGGCQRPPSYMGLPALDNTLSKQLADRRCFIHLHKVQPVHRGIDTSTEPSTYVADSEGKLIPAPSTISRRKIDGFNAWLEAFLIFVRYRIFHHPDLAPGFFAYIDIIRGLSLTRPLLIWLDYDRRFRERMTFPDSL